jgi:L,D-transpeptidase YcbB
MGEGTQVEYRSCMRTLVAVLILLVGCSGSEPFPDRMKARLQSVFDTNNEPKPDEVRSALLRDLRIAPAGASAFPSRETIDELYTKRTYRPAWSDESGKLVPETTALLEALSKAGDHGLDPEDYVAARLQALEKEIRQGKSDERAAARLADFDLLATAAFLRYASDVSTGRLHPDEVASDWRTNPPEIDPVSRLNEALASHDLARLIESLPPPHPGYARLCKSLAELREIEAAGGWPTIPPGPKMKAGSRDPRLAIVHERLGQESIESFQARHGIEPDGIVSDATLAELNVPVTERIRQVELNLERWRWIPRDLGDTHVLVNIPGFELELDQGHGDPWRTRVIAGKAFTPTPVLSDRIVAIVVNPPWNVPESIAKNELLPELRKNPTALERKGIRVLEGAGDDAKEVDPRHVDWRKVDDEKFPYRLRQDPGDENPLGRLKFDLTNDLHIYLHDTPASGAFGRAGRDLSHGCVRVENARELANRITSDAVRQKIDEALEKPDEQRIELDSKVPVHIFYWTAWADEQGQLHFGQDVYDFDKAQRAALDRVSGNLLSTT